MSAIGDGGTAGSLVPDGTVASVFAVAGLAVAARLLRLGERVAGFHEGRVATRALEFRATGDWAFDPVGGSPLLVHVDRWAFGIVGPSDAAARFAVAVLGGCLPLAALLLRDRLADRQVVGVAAVLAASPPLIYYSRSLSPVVPMAAFAVVAAGLVLRAVDREAPRYAYPAGVSLALAIASSPAAVPVLAVGGLAAWGCSDRSLATVGEAIRTDSEGWHRSVAGGTLLCLGLLVLLFAPRGSAGGAPGLRSAVTHPWLLPAVLVEALVGTSVSVVDAWTAGELLAADPFGALARGLYLGWWGAPVVTLFALLGVVRVAGRSEGDTSRSIGRFAAVWGLVLFVGAAIATGSTSIRPFVPAVVVLSIPAGIGLSWLLGRAVEGVRRDHLATGGLLVLLLSLIVLQTAAVAVDGVYRRPSADANPVAPTDASADRLGAVVDLAVHAAGKTSGSPDVRLYETADVGPADSLQPLPWYFAAGDATVATAVDAERLRGERPPVVVAPADRFETLEPHLGGYVAFPVHLPRADGRVIVFVRGDLLPRDRWKTTLSPGPAGS